MKRRLWIYLLGALLFFGSLEVLRHSYRRAAERMQPSLAQEVAAIEARYARAPSAPGAVIFVGSSSIRRWSSLARDMQPLRVLNHGFGGSELSHIIEYREALIDRHRPRALVIYSGDNDLDKRSEKTVSDVFADYRQLLEGLLAEFPELRVYCLAIKPSPQRLERWPLMKAANQRLEEWCQTRERVSFLDVATPLMDARGLPDAAFYLADGIHLNAAGYRTWSQLICQRLLQDLGD